MHSKYINMKNISKNLFFIPFLFSLIILTHDAIGQVNRSGKKHNYSITGKSFAVIRHGITAQATYGLLQTPFIGIGYNASQYFGIGNRFMQQSFTYQLGLQLNKLGDAYQSAYIHSLIASFHCSYIGTVDLSPLIYGISIQFATGKDTNVYQFQSDAQTNKGEYMSNIYLRPELGLSFPMKYSVKTKERKSFTFSVTYGYNIGLFMRRMELAKNELQELESQGVNVDYPWTSLNHHIITLRFNFNFVHYREFQ